MLLPSSPLAPGPSACPTRTSARWPAKWAIGQAANWVAGERIPDLNSGLRVFRRDLALQLSPLVPDGFSFTTTITLALITSGCWVDYWPINYYPRIGTSKIRPGQDMLNFVSLILRMALFFNPLHVFAPLSLLFFAAAGPKIVRDLIVFDLHVATSSIIVTLTALQIMLLGLVADLIGRTRR
jgi:hypothetical protein